MKASTILLVGLGGAGAWWLWKNRNMMPAPALGQPGLDPAMVEIYMRCITDGVGCTDAEYFRVREYLIRVMNQPGLTQEQRDWVAARIEDLDLDAGGR